MTLKHFLTTQDWSRAELDALLAQAAAYKRTRLGSELAGKSIALMFFNPSMRTRTSFELGAHQLGGKAIATWSEPKGGYFVSLDTRDKCATKVVEMAAAAGVSSWSWS